MRAQKPVSQSASDHVSPSRRAGIASGCDGTGSRLPEFVTFTGADDETSVEGMMALSSRYPVEWGILFSGTRQGREPRYPRDPARFLGCRMQLAAHLCGQHSRDVMVGEYRFVPWFVASFDRVQVNHPAPNVERISEFRSATGRRCIAQARGATFPGDDSVSWLYDRSGGRGVTPAAWPPHPNGPGYPTRLVGYAGGIGPENVCGVLAAIGATGPYWIDMESGVRTGDRFDLGKCRAVCEAVYSRPLAHPSGQSEATTSQRDGAERSATLAKPTPAQSTENA